MKIIINKCFNVEFFYFFSQVTIKKKGRFVGLARGTWSSSSSSLVKFLYSTDPEFTEQLEEQTWADLGVGEPKCKQITTTMAQLAENEKQFKKTKWMERMKHNWGDDF